MHLTDAGPVTTCAPSVVQEERGNDLTRGQDDGFADTCAPMTMVNFLKSYRPSRINRLFQVTRTSALLESWRGGGGGCGGVRRRRRRARSPASSVAFSATGGGGGSRAARQLRRLLVVE
jgi:hypothetical protein